MNKHLLSILIVWSCMHGNAQEYGHTLNLGIGIGYYGHVGHSIPVLHANYEFDVADNFTLAPFASFYSHRHSRYWGSPNHPYKLYQYSETVIPVGVKGSYYFDELLEADEDWDFYLAGSLGFALINSRWDSDYYGERDVYRRTSPLFLDLHVGAKYHLKDNLGLFLDLSTGASTFGVSIR